VRRAKASGFGRTVTFQIKMPGGDRKIYDFARKNRGNSFGARANPKFAGVLQIVKIVRRKYILPC